MQIQCVCLDNLHIIKRTLKENKKGGTSLYTLELGGKFIYMLGAGSFKFTEKSIEQEYVVYCEINKFAIERNIICFIIV